MTASFLLITLLFVYVDREESPYAMSQEKKEVEVPEPSVQADPVLKKESTPIPNKSASPKQKVASSKQSPSIQITSIQRLVNKQNGLPPEYVPPNLSEPRVAFLTQSSERKKMQKVAATALEKMFVGAKEDGISLAAVSGYRSYQTQKELYERYVRQSGQKEADRFSAKPGHSEHMTGLSMDIAGTNGRCVVTSCFANTKEAKWLAANSYRYGFILRYPAGTESITGYKYEPWHFRYVGIPLATFLYEEKITLEEYYQLHVKR